MSTASLIERLGHRTIETVEKYLYWTTDTKFEEFDNIFFYTLWNFRD